MRIGLFTDTYFPSTNGIVYVVEILRRNLQAGGHEVWIFAPEPRPRRWFRNREQGVIRFPALEGLLFDEQLTSFFFPPKQLKKITELELDVILLFTPAQIGLMGAYAALQNDTLLIQQYCTDLIAYVKQYPAVIPGVIALLLSTPFALKARPKELLGVTKALAKKNRTDLTRRQDGVRQLLNVLHDRCDALIAVSEKSAKQMANYHGRTPVEVVATGVDALAVPEGARAAWRLRWQVGVNDTVFLYAGRLAPEKNLELLLKAFKQVAVKYPSSKLVLVGGFSQVEVLRQTAADLGITSSVIFTDKQPRASLGGIYAAADIFCFPSRTDTQALVLNEAAHAGLPLIWCDEGVNDVAVHKKTGLLTAPTVKAFATAMSQLAANSTRRAAYGRAAIKQAQNYTEAAQTEKLAKVLSQYLEQN